MERKKYIGWGQLLFLLLMCRAFTLMTFVPFARSNQGLSLRLTAGAISALIQALLLVPVVLLKRDVTGTIMEKNRFWGIIAAAHYLVFFLVYAANSLRHFQKFLDERFFPEASGVLWTAVLLAVCVYCASLGTEALGRSAVLLFWIFFIALAVMVIFSGGEFDTANLYFDKLTGNGLFTAVMDDLSRSGEICAIAFLAGRVREKQRCGVYGFLASKLALVELMIFLTAAVLGDFAAYADYPFLSLGSFGGTAFRGDALYLIVWTITAVLNTALFLHISAELLGEIFPKLRFRTVISAVPVFALALFGGTAAKVCELICSGWAVIYLAGIIPLSAFIVSKKRNKSVIRKPKIYNENV